MGWVSRGATYREPIAVSETAVSTMSRHDLAGLAKVIVMALEVVMDSISPNAGPGSLVDQAPEPGAVRPALWLRPCGPALKANGALHGYRHIELTPARACMVDDTAGYRRTSHSANVLGKHDALVTPHANFLALDPDP